MFFIFKRFSTIIKAVLHQMQIRIVNRHDINIHNTVNFVLYGILYDAMLNFHKPFAIKFLQRIGGSDLHFSLYSSLPGLFAVFALIPGLMLINKSKNKKGITTKIFSMSRLMILFMVLTVYFPAGYQPIIFVLFLSLVNFFDAIGQSSLQSYLGDLFTPHKRAEAISLRNKFGNASIMVVVMLSGIILTIPKTDNGRIIVYQMFFFLSFLCGIGEIFIFNRFKDKPNKNSRNFDATPKIYTDEDSASCTLCNTDEDSASCTICNTDEDSASCIVGNSNGIAVSGKTKVSNSCDSIKDIFVQIFTDRKFLAYSALTLFFYFTFHMAWPLFNIYYVTHLNATELNIALSATLSVVPIIISSKWWGKQIITNGVYKTASLAIVGIGACCFALGSSPNVAVYIFFNTISGFFTGGVTNCLLAGLLENSGEKNRVMYIGVYNTFMNLSLGISPLVAHMILTRIGITPALYVAGSLRILAGSFIFLYYKRLVRKKA